MRLDHPIFASPDPGATAGDYRMPLGWVSSSSRTPSTSANVTAIPFFFARATAIDRLNIQLVTAQVGGEAMAGLYTNSGAGRPAALITDLGVKDLSSGGGAPVEWTVAATVNGFVWALIWLKNIATQVSITGPNAAAAGLTPVGSTGISGNASYPWLYLVAAYPASMPAAAPAVTVTAVTLVPGCMLRTA